MRGDVGMEMPSLRLLGLVGDVDLEVCGNSDPGLTG